MSPCMNIELHWRDRKHYYGLPLSFEVYAISRDRLFLNDGFLQQTYREVLLYRIRDISLSRSFSQRFFGVGTVSVTTADNEVIQLENIRAPFLVKELLFQNVEDQKRSRRFRFGEYQICDAETFPWMPDMV